MKFMSEITKITYEDEDCVFFRNPTQSAFYKSWGAKLIDLFVDNQKRWVWVFLKKDHEKLKARWKTAEENNMKVKEGVINERGQEI